VASRLESPKVLVMDGMRKNVTWHEFATMPALRRIKRDYCCMNAHYTVL
jgi:hypothetical protein